MGAWSIRAVFQPLVSLDTGETIGYEALARGPVGTPLECPEALLGYAARLGRLGELDWECRAAAVRGALEAGLPHQLALFVNIEPAAAATPCPPEFERLFCTARRRLQIVAEVTERDIAEQPEALVAAVRTLRAADIRVAIDDVGAEPDSQAMMPLLRPDVIKLDKVIVGDPTGDLARQVVAAARAQADETGAVILAEGIETEDDLAAARSLGADLGQGYLFGRPAALPRQFGRPSRVLPLLAA